MHVLNGHLEGRRLVLDDPMPDDVPDNAKVTITVDAGSLPKPRSLERIAKMAVSGQLPRDFSTQFKHYTKGLPRR